MMVQPRITHMSDGTDIFAIGDVHGRSDLLKPLLNHISAMAGTEPYRVVFLGDLIDRGPDSAGVIDLVLATLEAVPGSVLLLGNHEEFLLDIVMKNYAAVTLEDWRANGGVAAMQSLGIDPRLPPQELLQLIEQNERVRRVLECGTDMAITSTHLFVHAGIMPHRAFEAQRVHDVRWIRETFLESRANHGRIVVHGHTPTDRSLPEIHRNRIAMDTGAFFSGRLSAIRIPPGSTEPSFIQASDETGSIVVGHIDAATD